MRTYCHFDCPAFKCRKPLLWNSQFRRRTTPEQVRGRSWDHQIVGVEAIEAGLRVWDAQLIHLSINKQRLMPSLFDFVESEEQFERVMRLLAAEIDGAFKVPIRIN